MPKCQFTTKYYNYEIRKTDKFKCKEEVEEQEGEEVVEDLLASRRLCIFHDKDYLQDKTNYEEHKRQVLERLKHKVNHAISYNEPLLCIGFQLPDFSLSALLDFGISKEFTKPVYFSEANFQAAVDFSGSTTNFQSRANFDVANFQEEEEENRKKNNNIQFQEDY